jgi:penicillin-binding protein 2
MLSSFDDRRVTDEGRLLALRIGFVLCMCALAVGFWVLQVAQNAKYAEMAENNHLRAIPLRAPRGVLFDRSGRILVENRNSFTIAIVREQAAHLDDTVARLAKVTGVDPARIRDAVARHRREPLFRPLPVIEHATFGQVAAVAAHRLELPEVVVQEVPTRKYPEGLAAHLFGYVGEIQESQINSAEFASANLQPGAIVGQAGIEKAYNSELMGTDGNRFVVVNSVGREMDELDKEEPVGGERMELTIDYDLQRALEDGYRAGDYAGAAAILDPRNGEVLAMTSLPAYDPNDFATGIDTHTWSSLTSDPRTPLTDRLIQGKYSPGSTFKIVMALAALDAGVITPDTKFYCPGYATFYGRTFQCDKHSGHGWVDLRHAIEQSCNVYFYNVGSRMKIDEIHDYAAKLGLVGKTGIDLPGEVDSLVPSTAWKRKTFNQPWYPGETISVAIGQGAVSVTPIAMATMISAVANGGTVVTPHLVRAVDPDGHGWRPVPAPGARSSLFIKPDNLQAVRDGLWLVVNGAGTGSRARIDGHDVVGKTGTAQVISLQGRATAHTNKDLRDNGWFVFFAPRDNPQIAGVVFVEHGEHGGVAAAPIVRHVLETFFAKQEGKPLPPAPPPLHRPTPTPAPEPSLAGAPPAQPATQAAAATSPAGTL